MGYSFNGITKRITLSNGTTEFIVNDIYSRWKDWVRSGNANFQPAFTVIGGEDIGGGQKAGVYLFLENGWSIVPATVSTLTVVGNLVRSPEDLSGEPVFQQIGQQIQIIQRSSAVAIGYEAGGGTTLTPAQIWNYSQRSLTTPPSGGLSATQDSWLAALYATLQSPQAAGVFSTAALANAPAGGGGGFTNTDRTNLTAIKTKTDQLAFTSGNLNARVMVLDSAAIAQTVTAVDSSTKLSRMFRELGGEIGVSATVLDAQDGVPGYLRTSAGDRKIITKNPDGSVTISLDESGTTNPGLNGVIYDYFF